MSSVTAHAVAVQWQLSGSSVAGLWQVSGSLVAAQWQLSGSLVAAQWQLSGSSGSTCNGLYLQGDCINCHIFRVS